MKNEKYKQQLIEKIDEKGHEQQHRKERLIENILAGVCKNSILAQRKVIFMLDLRINCLGYKLQHDISYNMNHNE